MDPGDEDEAAAPRSARSLEEGNLGIIEATMRQLLDESGALIEETRAALELVENAVTRMREKHSQITAALARAAERRK